jgi:hypothetical protein
VLGVRRIRTRELPLFAALLPAIAFFAWSLLGLAQFAASVGLATAVGAWAGGAAIGAGLSMVFPEAPGQRLAGGRVRIPGSWLPLALYLGVFVARFACGTWAAVIPAQAQLATGVGMAIGAAMTARLVIGVLRWRDGNGVVAAV